MGEKQYRISAILTVKNGGDFLRESVDSILQQDWPFEEHVQLMLCDSGKSSGDSAVCQEYRSRYPENIVVIGGSGCTASEARNRALEQAEGDYLVFLSDDNTFAPETFAAVWNCGKQYETETDVVIVPTRLTGEQFKTYWRNKWLETPGLVHFDDPEREEASMAAQCIPAASFLRREAAKKFRFEGEEAQGGESLFLLKVLLEKGSTAVAEKGSSSYYCRNKAREPSVQEQAREPAWYDEYFDCLVDGILDYCQEKMGYAPEFVQDYLVTELAWRFRFKDTPPEMKGRIPEYQARLEKALRRIDDRSIMKMRSYLTAFECIQLFTIKYEQAPEFIYQEKEEDMIARAQGYELCNLSKFTTCVDYAEMRNGNFVVEGYLPLPVTVDPEQVQVWIQVGKQKVFCSRVERTVLNNQNNFGTLFNYTAFYGELPITDSVMKKEIFLYFSVDGKPICCRYLSLKRHCPVNSYFPRQYYYKDGVAMRKRRSRFYLYPCRNVFTRLKFEAEFLLSVRRRLNNLPDGSALEGVKWGDVARLRLRALLHKLNPWHKEIWLVSDRINRGDDNGEVFFKYMQEHQKKRERKVCFVIADDCPDYQRLSKIGPVVPVFSKKHLLYQMEADWILSSQANDPVLRPAGKEMHKFYQDLCHDAKFVFLQHGITKDNQSAWLNRYNRRMEGFVVTTQQEYDSVFEYDYYQPKENVWLTGMPRNDALYHDERNYITIMPTWRKTLTKGVDPVTSVWLPVEHFESSDYFQFYNGLLNSPRLLAKAEELGYTICYKPHPNFLSVLDCFQHDPRVIFFENDKSYREIYAQSTLLLTDYSSAVFDFALLDKPVIYAHFDAEEFFGGGHSYTEGYFSYERDGFGEVEYDLESTIDRIIEYMERGCKVKPRYEERIQKTFAFHDHDNCKRVYEKMMEVEAREKGR